MVQLSKFENVHITFFSFFFQCYAFLSMEEYVKKEIKIILKGRGWSQKFLSQ